MKKMQLYYFHFRKRKTTQKKQSWIIVRTLFRNYESKRCLPHTRNFFVFFFLCQRKRFICQKEREGKVINVCTFFAGIWRRRIITPKTQERGYLKALERLTHSLASFSNGIRYDIFQCRSLPFFVFKGRDSERNKQHIFIFLSAFLLFGSGFFLSFFSIITLIIDIVRFSFGVVSVWWRKRRRTTTTTLQHIRTENNDNVWTSHNKSWHFDYIGTHTESFFSFIFFFSRLICECAFDTVVLGHFIGPLEIAFVFKLMRLHGATTSTRNFQWFFGKCSLSCLLFSLVDIPILLMIFVHRATLSSAATFLGNACLALFIGPFGFPVLRRFWKFPEWKRR